MDWRLAMEAEEAVLKRIVALILALAGLAERASTRPRPVRGFVLWLLLPAEAVVSEFLTGEPMHVPMRSAGNSPAEAMRLAQSLRSLAALLAQVSCALSCADDIDDLPERIVFLMSGIVRHIGNAGTVAGPMEPALQDTS